MGKLSSLLKKALDALVPNKRNATTTSGIIVAGGSSTRMGGTITKQMLEICGKPVVVHTLLAFENTSEISEIIVVAKKEETELYKDFKKTYNLTKLKRVVVGGDTRQHSVANGFSAISEKSNFVAIHDGARCLITPDEISAVCNAAYIHDAATAAARAIDTIKLGTSSGFIEKTVDRNTVWHAQTPQIFSTALYNAALAICERDKVSVTDDCSMAEYINHPIKLVECSSTNMKITTADDIIHATAIIRKRNTADTKTEKAEENKK